MSEKVNGLNYEAEYHRMCEHLEKANRSTEYWKRKCEEAEAEREYCRGVISTIEVIFGRTFNNG